MTSLDRGRALWFAPEQSSPMVEQKIGAYKILSLLGKGGMGEVYLAQHLDLPRKVALKLLPAKFTSDPRRVRRFRQEALAASALNHPNIMTVYEVGEAEGVHFIAGEFIEGQTLRQLIQKAPMPLGDVLAVTIEVARALRAAHTGGIIHRDIKPENIMLRHDGYVKVLDFGLAKLIRPPSLPTDATVTEEVTISTDSGVVLGTVGYMSPEQVRGERVDVRSDLFNLGVVLYEMITGIAPFAATTVSDVLSSILRKEPPPLACYAPGIPAELERVACKALRKKTAERYQTAEELLSDLTSLNKQLDLEEQLERLGPGNFEPRTNAEAHNQTTVTRSGSKPTGPGKLIAVPDLPPHFLPRSKGLRALRDMVLANVSEPVAVTSTTHRVGVEGMGGIGKSVLATALARDSVVRRAFPDGVFWLTIGQEPVATARQAQIAEALGDGPRTFPDIQQGKARLSELLKDKACLLILDDVWLAKHVEPFDVLGSRCRMVITTRDAGLVRTIGAIEHRLEVLTDEEALALLSQWAGQELASLPTEAHSVARECGNLPLALAMIGAMVRGNPNRWSNALRKLQSADLARIRQQFPNYPYPHLLRTIQVSVEALEPESQACYIDFAVFPDDTVIPETALQLLWGPKGMNEYDIQDVLDVLVDRSLAQRDEDGRFRLHDLQLDYVRKQVASLPELHKRLLSAYSPRRQGGWSTVPSDGYFFEHLTYHLSKAEQTGELLQLLLDFDWLQAKLDATDINALIADYAFVERDDDLNLIQGSLQLSAHVLIQDTTQLRSQLYGRLRDFRSTRIIGLLKQAIQSPSGFWLRSQSSSLVPPGGPLVRTLAGHSAAVHWVEVFAQGKRAVSASLDGTLKIWDLESGRELHTLNGHVNGVQSVAVFANGRRAVSASRDKTLKIWDIQRGRELQTLIGHSSSVQSVAVSPDGRRIVSASQDKTLKIWDSESGQELSTLVGHTNGVQCVVISSDGSKIISASWDDTLRIWDLKSGRELCALTGFTTGFQSVALFPDGRRAISASDDQTIRIWDIETGRELRTLEGHSKSVRNVTLLPDGRRAVSASADHTLKVWDLERGQEVRTLEGHTDAVRAVKLFPDSGRAISASDDRTLKIWDLQCGRDLHRQLGHSGAIRALAVHPTTLQALSASADHTLKIWDLDSGQELRTLEGHTEVVWKVAILADGRRALSASDDRTLRIWDLESGRVLYTLRGHSEMVRALTVFPDGQRAISASDDRTLKIWDLENGGELQTLRGHTAEVRAVAAFPDGQRVVSASDDRTLRIWDVKSGQELHTLKGHGEWVKAVAVFAGGRRAISASKDKTLKVWDLESRRERCTLTGHTDGVLVVMVLPGEHRAISASWDKTLRLWDLEIGKQLSVLVGHTREVVAVAVFPDGQRIVSVSEDCTLKVWDLKSGRTIAGFTCESGLTDCAIASDGVTILAGDRSGRLHMLHLEGM